MIHFENKEGVGIITLDNPQSLNALNSGVLRELDDIVKKVSEDSTVRIVLITGVGKAFVAGADIKEMSVLSETQAMDFAKVGLDTFHNIASLKVPTVALINGFALGGGMELALACDIRYAVPKAKLGQPEVTLGIIPGFGGTQRLARLVGPSIAKDLIFTGRMISAEEALNFGIVNRIVEEDQLMETGLQFAEMIKKVSKNAVSLAKQAIDDGLGKIPFDIEQQKFAHCFSHEDQKEGMDAFINKRKPNFKED